ncbi:MAG: hypothetical protein M3063_03825 [Actinomycetota bacterium]|nr:hypothetical protein [Actinomycetota bacterium]
MIGGTGTGTDLVARAAQAPAILSLPGDDDTALLLTRMPTAGEQVLFAAPSGHGDPRWPQDQAARVTSQFEWHD